MGRRRRRKVEPTDDWELLLPPFEWLEQEAYEELRPLVGGSVAERSEQTGTLERTMYRRIERFEKDGIRMSFTHANNGRGPTENGGACAHEGVDRGRSPPKASVAVAVVDEVVGEFVECASFL